MESTTPLLNYSTKESGQGERAVKSVSAVMVGLSTSVGVLEVAMFLVTHVAPITRANSWYFRGHEELVRCDRIVNCFAGGFLIFAGIVYLLRKGFVVPLFVASALLVSARILDAVCYAVGPYRGSEGWMAYYLVTWLAALVGIRVMIPLANVVWFTRPQVRAIMSKRRAK